MALQDKIHEEIDSNYWSTKKVEELLYKAEEEGLDFKGVDNPFHDGDPSLKRANVLWEYTREEILEIERCSKDAVYFAKQNEEADTIKQYILFIDIESTGLDPKRNGIIQIAGIIEINGEVKEKFQIFNNLVIFAFLLMKGRIAIIVIMEMILVLLIAVFFR
jgi:uncharacterized protein YprB with RNaseH-like and TPR domain